MRVSPLLYETPSYSFLCRKRLTLANCAPLEQRQKRFASQAKLLRNSKQSIAGDKSGTLRLNNCGISSSPT